MEHRRVEVQGRYMIYDEKSERVPGSDKADQGFLCIERDSPDGL